MSLAHLDRTASVGLTDPTTLRRTLRAQRAHADTQIVNKQLHPGFHPLRVLLGGYYVCYAVCAVL